MIRREGANEQGDCGGMTQETEFWRVSRPLAFSYRSDGFAAIKRISISEVLMIITTKRQSSSVSANHNMTACRRHGSETRKLMDLAKM